VKTFGREELLAFLQEIDELLAEPVAIEIIGGAAALLAYGARRPTKDIDSGQPRSGRSCTFRSTARPSPIRPTTTKIAASLLISIFGSSLSEFPSVTTFYS
jgi:hypothetical protein